MQKYIIIDSQKLIVIFIQTKGWDRFLVTRTLVNFGSKINKSILY